MSTCWHLTRHTLQGFSKRKIPMSDNEIGGIYGQRALNLHAQRRTLIDSIEDAQRLGKSTEQLRADLKVKQSELDAFRAYLAARP